MRTGEGSDFYDDGTPVYQHVDFRPLLTMGKIEPVGTPPRRVGPSWDQLIDDTAAKLALPRADVERAVLTILEGPHGVLVLEVVRDVMARAGRRMGAVIICRACKRSGARRVDHVAPTGETRTFRRPKKRGGGTELQHEYTCRECARTFWTLQPPATPATTSTPTTEPRT
jgi:hypothetical protein